jgi:uncharacterized protein YjbJ (UPF0337 family)
LTNKLRPRNANIGLGKTALWSNSGRIAPLTSRALWNAAAKVGRSTMARETTMTWDQIEGNWLHFKGKLMHNWAKLTDEDITRINGRRDELAARLQERYGFARSEAEREIGAWIRSQKNALVTEAS